MSQSLSQFEPDWLTVSLVKFSHNSSPPGLKSFVWKHVGQRNDLNLIIRNTRIVDQVGNYTNRLMMKMTTGTEVLVGQGSRRHLLADTENLQETHDLGELARIAREFDVSSDAEHPLQVVSKSPFLALRYPKSEFVIRRIQVKFHNDSDFNKVLNVFKELKLPNSEPAQRMGLNSQPSASPAPSTLSPVSRSSTTIIPSLPPQSASLRNASYVHGEIHVNSSNSQSRPEFKIPELPDSLSSQVRRPASAEYFNIASGTLDFNKSTSHPSNPLISSNDFAKLLPSPFMHRSVQESSNRERSFPTLPEKREQVSLLPRSLFISQLEAQQQLDEENSSSLKSPFFASQKETEVPLTSSHLRKDAEVQDENKHFSFMESHISKPLYSTLDFQSWMPPRRDLPHLKAPDPPLLRSASASDITTVKTTLGIRPSSAAAIISDDGKEVSTPNIKAPTKRVANRKSTIIPVVEDARSAENLPAISRKIIARIEPGHPNEDSSPLAAKSAAARPSSAASGLPTKAAPKKRAAPARPSSGAKRPKMTDQSTQTQIVSVRVKTPTVVSLPPLPTPDPEKQDLHPPTQYLRMIDDFVTQNKTRPAPVEIWQDPRYLEADENERQAMMDEFFCKCVENDNFVQLCEDMNNSWRRIGLGM